MIRILAAAILLAGLSQAALADDSSSNGTSPGQAAQSTQPTQTIPAALRQKLTDAGFTDVKIVPSSFVVQAKDKQGHPVLMQISPDSMTMLTAVPVDSSSTTGSDSSEGSSTSSNK